MLRLRFGNVVLKLVFASFLLVLAILQQGCASVNTGSFEHGIAIANYGENPVYDITIFYGARKLEFAGRTPRDLAGGGLWNAGMFIPSEMTVLWHSENGGVEHRMTISLKDKVSKSNQLANWRIRFYGDRIELWREDNTGPLNRHTGIWPREVQKVFP